MITLKNKVKDWYVKEYPTDEMGKDIPNNLTFKDINEAPELVYGMLGNAYDSIIRERIFECISEINQKPYDVIYEAWLNG